MNRDQVGRFALGAAIGFLSLPVVGGAVWLGLAGAGLWPEPVHRSMFAVDGQDASAAGATSILVVRQGDVTMQTCQGACDDLRFDHNREGSLAMVNVFRGEDCILCQRGGFAHDPLQAQSLELSGRPLSIGQGAQP